MRLILYLLLPLAVAQLPFNIFNIPPAIRNPLFKTALEVAKVDSQCFRDLRKWFNDLLLAGLTAQKCSTLECFTDEKITNATYAMQILASTGHPQSLAMDELSLTLAGDSKLCAKVDASPSNFVSRGRFTNLQGPYATKYCFLHVHIDWDRIDFGKYGISFDFLPGGKIPDIDDREGIDRCSTMSANSVKLAVCLPASCERDADIGRILADATNGTARLCEISCAGPKEEPDSFFYLLNIIILLLLAIAIVASLLDYYVARKGLEEDMKGKIGWKLLCSFSIPRNTVDIFSIQKGPDAILCLDSIRFISFTWVAITHCNVFMTDGDSPLGMFREMDNFLSELFLNSYVAVDTFFLLSGLLVSFTFFKHVHKDPSHAYDRFKWMMYYVHRWLRLTPAYILFLWFYTVWTPRLHDEWAISGAQNSSLYVENCKNYWWMNALYLNNFQHITHFCYPISWFLAVDMQLYFVAPLFLLSIYYSWRSGLGAVAGGVLLSAAVTVFLTVHNDLPALGFTVHAIGNLDYFTQIYMKPWTRCIPYLTGILCGYLIVQIKEKTVKIRQPKLWEAAACWMLSTILALTVVFSVYDYVRGHSDWNVAVRSLYGCFSRIGWSIAISWVVLACTFDWAGPVKTLLEHPLWYPLGRLSYCAYLVHWFILHFILNGGDRPSHFVSLWNMYLTLLVPVVFLSYLLAYAWSCLVEIPFMNIEAIVVGLLTDESRRVHTTNGMLAQPVNSKQEEAADVSRIISIEVNYPIQG